MQTQLMILGFLMGGKLYGYDIRKKIVEKFSDLLDIKFGSIYYALRVAVQKGWVKSAGKEKDGGSPERFIYQITPAGEKHYIKTARKYFEDSKIHFEVDVMLLFLDVLPKEQKEQFKEEKIQYIMKKLEEVRKKIQNPEEKLHLPLNAYVENHLKAELAWVKNV